MTVRTVVVMFIYLQRSKKESLTSQLITSEVTARQQGSFKEILVTQIPFEKSQTLILILAIHVIKRITYHQCVLSVLPALTLLALTRKIQKMRKLNYNCLYSQGPGKEDNTSA